MAIHFNAANANMTNPDGILLAGNKIEAHAGDINISRKLGRFPLLYFLQCTQN
jgi:hypothetical protein